MSEKMMPLEEFLKLNPDDQVEKLKRWKTSHTLKDIREVWNFKHSTQYYMLLKKLRIYERVVNKSDKFSIPSNRPSHLSGSGDESFARQEYPTSRKLPSDSLAYHLNAKLSGPELADKLERMAHFLKGERKEVSVSLSIEAVDAASPLEHKQS